MLQNFHVLLTFDKVHNPLHLPRKTTSERPKVVRTPGVFLNILTSKCVSRHNGVHFFDISTSKVSEHGVFWCVLYILTSKCASRHEGAHFFHIATLKSAREISTSKRGPNMVCLYILTSKCASRFNGVHFFNIATSKSGPSMWCFLHFDLEISFAPQRRAIFHLSSGQMAPHPPLSRAYFSTLRSHNHWKNSLFRDFPTFSRTLHLLSSDSFSSLIFSLLLFSSLLLIPSLLFICPYLGSLTSKLPSNRTYTLYNTIWYDAILVNTHAHTHTPTHARTRRDATWRDVVSHHITSHDMTGHEMTLQPHMYFRRTYVYNIYIYIFIFCYSRLLYVFQRLASCIPLATAMFDEFWHRFTNCKQCENNCNLWLWQGAMPSRPQRAGSTAVTVHALRWRCAVRAEEAKTVLWSVPLLRYMISWYLIHWSVVMELISPYQRWNTAGRAAESKWHA